MGVPYKFFYRIGFHPWEALAEHPRSPGRSRSCSRARRAGKSHLMDRRSTSDAAAVCGGCHWQSAVGR